MARSQLFLCSLVLLATWVVIADAHALTAYTESTLKAAKPDATVKLVVHNVAEKTVTFVCAELGKDAKPVTATKGQWTAIGPINVSVRKNSLLHFTVSVATGKRYGVVKKTLVIDLLKQFQYNLVGSKFLVLTVTENARQGTLKLLLGRVCVLTFKFW